MFKQVEFPSFKQFFVILTFETFYAVGAALMYFFGMIDSLNGKIKTNY